MHYYLGAIFRNLAVYTIDYMKLFCLCFLLFSLSIVAAG